MKWISVKKQKPPKDGRLLFFAYGENIFAVAFWKIDGILCDSHWECPECGEVVSDDFTHWMIAEYPTQEANDQTERTIHNQMGA